MMNTLKLFNDLYEFYAGYNYFEYEDIILFDFVDVDGEIQTIKYIKNEDKLLVLKNV